MRAYRADIDGIRGVAVIAVVLYHLHVDAVHGGFIGVDIFFVISGFLITGIINEEINATGRFSVARFYERRIRRIFPALFAVLAACTGAAAFLLLPSEFLDFSHSLIATALFFSNYHFLTETGYFAPGIELKPLLHTWSLAVEEQFYLFFPLFLIGIARVRRVSLKLSVAVVFAISFGCSMYLVRVNPDEAFYSALLRAWELLTGSLLALTTIPRIGSRLVNEILGILGIILVIASAILYGDATPFPGAAALVPTVGAALLIYSGTSYPTFVRQVLGSKFLVFVGLISYSLYLWHWPLIVFSRMAIGHELTHVDKAAIFVISIALAVISWHFIEKPWRSRDAIFKWPKLAYISMATIALVCGIATNVVVSDGFPQRFPQNIDRIASYANYDASRPYRLGTCFLALDSARPIDRRACLSPVADRPNYLLVGDSHAADLWVGLQNAFPSLHFLQATAIGCKPISNDVGREPCAA